jgi:hypothetical protein
VRCRELDISKILGFFGKSFVIFWIFSGDFFLGIFLGGFFWEGFFGRNSLLTLELICLSRFWFLSRFCLNGEGRKKKFRSLEVRAQAHRT